MLGMVERGEHVRLTLQPGEPVRVGVQLLRQDLDRHVPLQRSVVRPVHLSHAAGAQRFEDFVVRESLADHVDRYPARGNSAGL